MSQIGYYNYYNNPHRVTVDEPKDRYQHMVEVYEARSNSLHANNEDPYSEENIKIRNFEIKLSEWAEGVRAQCPTVNDVYNFLSRKYYGKEASTFMDRLNLDDATRAAYDNDLNAILYGTYQNTRTLDPRLNWTEKDWDTYEADRKASNLSILNNQMSNILNKNGITVGDSPFMININPYDYSVSLIGEDNSPLVSVLSGENGKELLYYILNNSDDIDAGALKKYRAYHEVIKNTGYNLSQLTLKDGQFYTYENENILDILQKGINNNKSIPMEFKGAAYEHAKSLVDFVAEKGWNSIPDLKACISYSIKDGFISLSKSYDA